MLLKYRPLGLTIVGLLLELALSDLDNKFPKEYVSNPIARHVSFPVEVNTAAVAQLSGFEEDGHQLEYYITSLPAAGKLYETSQNYRSYGTDPKHAPTPIMAHQLPFLVTDPAHRVSFIPPQNVFPPVGRWASFTYQVKDLVTNIISEDGRCVLNNGQNTVVGSTFVSGPDGWTIEGNIKQVTPVHQPFAWGKMNRYIYGTDEVQYVDFDTGMDKQKWYFVAPESYASQDLATAYGGVLKFTVKATYGDFDYLNQPPALNWVVLECAECNNNRGLRIVRSVDAFFSWFGEEKVVELPIRDGYFWARDPLNGALPYTNATVCEIAATLNGLSSLKILGDFTKAGEGVAIDDVAITASPEQPVFPIECQQGCTCKHYPAAKRINCCGNEVQVSTGDTTDGSRRLEMTSRRLVADDDEYDEDEEDQDLRRRLKQATLKDDYDDDLQVEADFDDLSDEKLVPGAGSSRFQDL